MNLYNTFFGGFGILMFLIYIGLIGLSIYLMILMIKALRRGIKALDIYLEKNDNNSIN